MSLAVLTAGAVWGAQLPIAVTWHHQDADATLDWFKPHIANGAQKSVVLSVTIRDAGGIEQCSTRRFDRGGFLLWNHQSAGRCEDVATDAGGNAIVAASRWNLLGHFDYHVVKLAPDGTVVFDHWWGGSGEQFMRGVVSVAGIGIVAWGSDPVSGGWVFGLDALSGAVNWSYQLHSPASRAVPGGQGRVVFNGYDNGQKIQALDADGNLQWSLPVSDTASWSALHQGAGLVLYAEFEGVGPKELKVYAFDTADGALLWQYDRLVDDSCGGERPSADQNALGETYVVIKCAPASGDLMKLVKLDPQGNEIWFRDWTDPSGGLVHPIGLAVDGAGDVAVGLRTSTGTATVGFSDVGDVLWEEFTYDDATGDLKAIEMVVDSVGYPAIASWGNLALLPINLWRFGSPYDPFEPDRNWILAHPWLHPAGPPQYHNFLDNVDDFISFHARAGQSYRITATAIGSMLSGVEMQLYSGTLPLNTAVPAAPGADATTELVWTATVGGTYQVRLSPIDGTIGPDREYSVALAGELGPSHLWSRQYGAINVRDILNDIHAGPDGTYWVAGNYEGTGSSKAGIYRFAENGQLLSSYYYGGAVVETGETVMVNADGNVVLGITSDSFSTNRDVMLLELNAGVGPPLKVRRYEMDAQGVIYDLQRAPDGGAFVLAGHDVAGFDSLWLMRLDADGLVQWSRSLAATDGSDAIGLAMNIGEEIVVAGYVGSDGLLAKLGRDGELRWVKLYDTGSGFNGWFRSVVENDDGSLTVVGTHWVDPSQLWVMRTDADGEPEWSLGYPDGSGRAILAMPDGGYIVAGQYNGNASSDGWLVGLDDAGALRWDRVYDDLGQESFSGLDRTDDGGAVVAGLTLNVGFASMEMFTAKTSGLGGIDDGCSWQAPTEATPTEVGVDSSLWSFTVDTFAPIVVQDETIGWGPAIFPQAPEECGLHEPGNVTGTLQFHGAGAMSWSHAGPEDTFTIYRGTDVGDTAGFECLGSASVPTYDDTEVPAPGELWAYLIVADGDLGEGPMGSASDGTPRPHPIDCFPPNPF